MGTAGISFFLQGLKQYPCVMLSNCTLFLNEKSMQFGFLAVKYVLIANIDILNYIISRVVQ